MFWRSLKTKIVHQRGSILSHCSMSFSSVSSVTASPSNQRFTNDLLRERLAPYLDRTPSYLDELSKEIPRLKRARRASVLVPLYCNEQTNRVEVLLIKRSEKLRSHTGMVAFPGGMADPTDRDAIFTAEREAEEEIGLESNQYSILGSLIPITDSRMVIITPVVALLHSPKFVDFRLSPDEASDAFYVDLEQFLFANENYKMMEAGDDFITHHFQLDKYYIWGVTAYQLILLATVIYQRVPNFPVYRHGVYLNLPNLLQQEKDFFRFCVDYGNRDKIRKTQREISQL